MPGKTTAFHWGSYRLAADGLTLLPAATDERPASFGTCTLDDLDGPCRLGVPLIRRGWLDHGPHQGAGERRRGRDDYVPVPWPVALDHAAAELDRVLSSHGNAAIFAGSYGWGSAGRFHHPQGQLHRFLNLLGGYTGHRGTYSIAAIEHMLPRVVGMDWKQFSAEQTCWRSLEENTELFVCFGGMSVRNAQVSPGGAGRHRVAEAIGRCAARGARFVNISPDRTTLVTDPEATWLALKPGTDTALMLSLAHELIVNGWHRADFLETHCTGYAQLERYILGEADGVAKSADWAAPLTGVAASAIRDLARDMARSRTMITMSWSIQRTRFGEQPVWMGIALAAILGQVGLPGGGFGIGYGAVNHIGNPFAPVAWAALPQGRNAVSPAIPVARFTDMLLNPGQEIDYDGKRLSYPDIRLVYWAGGNPFHHQQDLNRLVDAWQRPETVIVHELQMNALARHADIVLPAAAPYERSDFAAALREDRLTAMHRLRDPYGEARTDHAIFRELSERLGVVDAFTEGRDEMGWIRHLYERSVEAAAAHGITIPDFETFWAEGEAELPQAGPRVLLQAFRRDPVAFPLPTPSGRIELFSEEIARFRYDDCPPHPAWLDPDPDAWADAPTDLFQLVSPQPADKLHSQNDAGPASQASKIFGRECIRIHPDDARRLGLASGDVVLVWSPRGRMLAVAALSADLRPGVVSLPTGTWLRLAETPLGPVDRNGNPNVLTRDLGTSRLSQGTTAMTCMVALAKADAALLKAIG